MAGKLKSLVWPVIIIGAVAVIDQVTKFWAVDALSGRPSVSVIGDFFRLTLVYNLGGAMGTSIGSPVYYLVIALIIIPVLLFVLYQYRHVKSYALPLAFICGGAIGNLIDRIRLGQVVDFLDVDFFDISIAGYQLDRWWTFNVADAAISCGLVFLLVRMLFFKPAPAANNVVSSPTSVSVE